MATTGKLSLDGLRPYLEDLARAGQNVDAAAKTALEAGGEVIAREMVQRVPKDTHHLEETIAVDGPYQSGNFVYVQVGVITGDKETAIYGNVQEFGSSSVEAQPYVRPSFQAKKAAAMRAMKQSLQSAGVA